MDKINKTVRNVLIFAIALSVGFAVGIPAIVLGAVNKIWAIMVIGIILVIAGFYGTPIIWVQYGAKRRLKRFVSAIENEHLYTVEDLAMHLNEQPEQVKATIHTIIEKGYISGYLFDGETLQLNLNRNKKEDLIQVVCESCGAKYTHSQREQGTCPYCGTISKQS